jgi:hypothetical protein
VRPFEGEDFGPVRKRQSQIDHKTGERKNADQRVEHPITKMNKQQSARRRSRSTQNMQTKTNNNDKPRTWTTEQLKRLAAVGVATSELAAAMSESAAAMSGLAQAIQAVQRQEQPNPPRS